MIVELANFDKRFNSTKNSAHYAILWDSYECKLLAPSSILRPILLLENEVPDRPSKMMTYNYARIVDLDGRYYFINDIISRNNLWELHLEIDVLGTYEYEISISEQYISRSTLFGNGYLYDGLYPTSTDNNVYIDTDYQTSVPNYERADIDVNNDVYRRPYQKGALINEGGRWTLDRNYFNTDNIKDGGFVMGVLGGSGTGVTYYAMTRSAMLTVLDKIAVLRPSGASDISNALASMLFNGLQYVTSLTWYPTIPTIVDTQQQYVTSFNVGGQNISGLTANTVYDISANPIEEFYFDIEVPRHPKTKSNSDFYLQYDYLNCSPYRQANLYFQPFGNFPIDVSKFRWRGTQTMRVNWAIDYTTGSVLLRLFNDDNDLIYSTSSTIGVTVPLSNIAINDRIGQLGMIGYMALNSVKDNISIAQKIPGITKVVYAGANGFSNKRIPAHPDSSATGTYTESTNGNVVNDIINLGIDSVAHLLGQVNTLGTTESYISYLAKPFVYCWYKDIVQPAPQQFGRPANRKATLNSYRRTDSFVKCCNANVEFTSAITMEERSMIIQHLNSGFYME